eukprot:UN10507
MGGGRREDSDSDTNISDDGYMNTALGKQKMEVAGAGEEFEEDGEARWVVEYESAVTALCIRVLKEVKDEDDDEEGANVPNVVIKKEEDELFIYEWYCRHELGNEVLLT